ncbi:helix-turn-helix domain-containing protein [Arthrobacter rhombi]|uniref:AraC family transcriptional regulator n=1 Tax=Arthrobacter rhombi TaxID=71253 RepID=UPI0031D91D4F
MAEQEDLSASRTGGVPSRPAKELRFSTRHLPTTNRLEQWEHHNAKALISLDIRTLDEAPLEATEVNLYFPALRFARVKGSAQVVERSANFIRHNPTDVVAIFFALEGEAFFYHRGGNANLKPGQAIMYDADLPFMRGFSQGLQELVLTIPRDDFKELSGGKQLTKPQIFDFNRLGATNQPANALAKLIMATIGNPDINVDRVEQSAMDLLRLLISGENPDAGTGHLAVAMSYIDRQLRDPQLSAGEIAAAVGISERQLSRVFAQDGTSLSHFVRDRRLQLARKILIDPGTPISMGRLAAELGFASQSYFARVFKEHFGVTPLQLRQDTAAGRILRSPVMGDDQELTEYS